MTLQLTPWQPPPSQPKLTTKAVHLWRFPLTSQTPLKHLINKEEQQRADRLRIPEKAQAFVVARARLRQILASYLDLDPQSLNFSYGPSGKPALIGVADAPAFNLAHSGDWGLFAVAKEGEVVPRRSAILQLGRLADDTDPASEFVSRGGANGLLEQPDDPARFRIEKTDEHSQQRRLARAVGSEDPEILPRLEGKIDAVYDVVTAVAFADARELENQERSLLESRMRRLRP